MALSLSEASDLRNVTQTETTKIFLTKPIKEKITSFNRRSLIKAELFDCEINVATECMIQ